MPATDAQIAANIERRRSERWPLATPVIVSGIALDSKPFQEDTITLSVSTHGALLALATTVTLGQTLYLRNPQTQNEAGAWVTRFGHPRGGLAQVGIEFVQPDEKFWSNKPGFEPAAAVVNDAATDVVRGGTADVAMTAESEAVSLHANDTRINSTATEAQISQSESPAQARAMSPAILLQALEQTLRQAAEQAVAVAATASLGPAVNHAAAAIEKFSRDRLQQLEERLVQYQHELLALAREELFSQVQGDVSRFEDHFSKRAEELIEGAARNAHRDFAGRLGETANQVAIKFAEDAIGASANHFARIAQEIQTTATQAQAQMESKAAEFSESQAKARTELDRAVAEFQQKVESLTTLIGGAYAGWDNRLRAFQVELTASEEQKIQHFREQLRNILTTLLNSLE
jgi:hypothetical protein